VPVHGVALDRAFPFVRDPAFWAGAVASFLGIGDLAVLPPEVVPGEHAGPLGADALVHRRDLFLSLFGFDQPQRPLGLEQLRERGVLARKRDLAAERCEAVAVAAVDRLLGCPQCREWLSPFVCIVELRAHQRA